MPTPRFADPSSPTRTLHVVAGPDLSGYLAALPTATRDWITAGNFTAALGELSLLPGPAGVAGAVAGLGTAGTRARQRFGIAKAIAGLPGGNWALTGDLTSEQRDEITLAWLLQLYRFDRYRPCSRPQKALILHGFWRWPKPNS